MSFSEGSFFGDAFAPDAFAFDTPTPPPSIVIDTHDGADRHYRDRSKERAKIREQIERLFDGKPLPEIEEVIAALPAPREAFSAERIEQMVRALEEIEQEREDEEALLMVLH